MGLSGKPRSLPTLKAEGEVTVSGRGGFSRGGVADRGASEEDDPVTWETPGCPGQGYRGSRRPRTVKPPAPSAFANARWGKVEEAFALLGRLWRGDPEPRSRPQGSRRAA